MQAILGVIFHFFGGFASGSFYIPYKKVKGWSWESYWIVGGLFSWLIVPPVAAYLTIPDFWDILAHASDTVIWVTYIFGVLWGIGGLTYGLGVRYLGVSLGSSIILGLCSVFGALIPSIYYYYVPTAGKDSIYDLVTNTWGQMVLLGLLICVIGIVICGWAGSMKDRDLKGKGTDLPETEFKLGLGLFVSIISGILSACFAFGIDSGKSMAEEANHLWQNINPGAGEFLYQNNVTYIVIMLGGLTTNFLWCMLLNYRNKSFGDYTNPKTPLASNYLFSALAGTTWFLQFFFYGMGESKLGNGPSSWILHMAFIILVANAWGLILKEWKGVSRKTLSTIIYGILAIIISILVVGYGNYLHE
ncbi:L-rhamnose-H+ transport protein [Dyadobacter jejuensis]|uniref:L-rhamnose-H+ transport protein n=1 Tax=Dyadobacter jejuensis TaxID=1082580 RepID=A0A316ARV5_9BACT|nr:L-rhamnose/proton symporter RhaT [Dyadobacter jejuensis]PWJ60332.1 L-rhamnose-H+ transport protein [Dyadobacter jejuensis]